MRTRWAWWGIGLFVLGVVMERHSEFIRALAVDRLVLLAIGFFIVLLMPLVAAMSLDDEDRRNRINKGKEE